MTTKDDVLGIVEAAMLTQPRNLQQVIGPSEVGIECDRCLGHKLAQTPRRQTLDWQPYVGTAVHAQLEKVFLANPAGRWVSEERVLVGQIDGEDIWGTSDLFDMEQLTVVDYKTASATKLKSVRASGGADLQHQIQVHLYGRGWHLYGFTPRSVAIWYLPRDGQLDRAVWWEQPFNEQVALDALARANAFAQAIRILGADQFLSTLQRNPDHCYDCPRYPAYPTDQPLPNGQQAAFADLIAA